MGANEALRRFALLPYLLGTGPPLVLYRGGDSLSICSNTIALVFIIDCDDYLYAYGLPHRMRNIVEEFGRAEIDSQKAHLLAWVGPAHVLVALIVSPLAVWMAGYLPDDLSIILSLSQCFCMLFVM